MNEARGGARTPLSGLSITLLVASLLVLVPVATVVSKATPASADQVSGPPDANGNWAYCFVNSMRNDISSGTVVPEASLWVSCQYGPTSDVAAAVYITLGSSDWVSYQGDWYNSYLLGPDHCGGTEYCQIDQDGLFQESIQLSGTDAPTTPWNDLQVIGTCFIYLASNPTVPEQCSATVYSKASTTYPPFPDYWFSGGVDGNTTPEGQTFGSGSSLAATDPTGVLAEPVDTYTGNFYTEMTDAYLPGFSLPFTFTRSFNSLANTITGPLGNGWTDTYNISLGASGGGDITVYSGDGQEYTFAKQSDGSYLPSPGVFDTLVQNADGTYSLTRKDQVVYAFKSNGQLKSITDRVGNQVACSYSNGLLSSITDTTGRVITFTYNSSGHMTKLSLPDGRSVSYTYSGGDLVTVTDLRGNTWTYGYNAQNRLISITDPRGTTTVANTYSGGRVATQTDGDGNETTFSWDANTNTETVTDARGYAWKDVYDHGRLIKRIDPFGNTTTYAYTGNWEVKSVTDASGNTWTYTYDGRGNMLTATDPLGDTTTAVYNANNDPTSVTDPLDQTTTYAYGGNGNLRTVTQPGGVTTSYTHDSTTGQLTSITDPNGNTTTFAYGPKGNLTTITDALGRVTTASYDSGGRMTSLTDPRSHTWTYAYDAGNALLSTTDPLNHTTSYVYTKIGELRSVTDPDGNTTTYLYDGNGALERVTGADGSVTTYAYSPTGELSSRTDPNHNATTYAYDKAGRLTGVTDALGNTWQYAYEANGQLQTATLPSNDSVSYVYDDAGRLTNVNYSNANTPDVGLSYDADGNLTGMTDGGGSVAYGYDSLNRLVSVTRGSDTFSYQYDAGSRITQRTYPGNSQITYGYDKANELTSVTANGQTDSYQYNDSGDLASAALGNGVTTTYTWDAANRLTGVASVNGGTTISSFTSTLDAAGNPTKVVTPSETATYSYDALNRVTKVCYLTSCSGSGLAGIAYGYDGAGNITSKSTYGSSPSTTTYAYNADEELCWAYQGTSSNGCSSPPTGATTYGYDANGNETSAGSESFTYDSADRLASATQGGTTESYTYDGAGNRLTQSVGGSLQESFLWDPSASLPLLALERGASGATLRSYAYGAGIGQGPLSMTTGGSTYYYLPDNQGSVANLTSSSGATEWTYAYEPYGAARTTTKNDQNAPDNPIGFAGQYTDASTGLLDLRARSYDPSTGRFLSLDPVGASPGGQGVSPYAYAFDQPTVLSDPSGLAPGTTNWFESWLCGGPCGATFSDMLANPVACWAAGPMWMKQLGFAMIAVSASYLAPELIGAIFDEAPEAVVAEEDVAAEESATAFHYTTSQFAESIEQNGLRAGTYATPNGELSPLQAQLDLSMPPNRALPDIKVEIDVAGLRSAGYDIPDVTRVSNVVRAADGRVYSMPGGGYEMQFPYPIPPEFIKVVP